MTNAATVFTETDRDMAAALFERIRTLSASRHGVSRPCYSDMETSVIEIFAAIARDAGLKVRTDAAANLVVELPGDSAERAYWVGSHFDSVPEGGNYDGLAGVVAGLLCLLKAKQQAVPLERPLTLVGLRGEEAAWFGQPYLGSSALLGLLTAEALDWRHRDSGRPLAEYLEGVGADMDRIRRQERLVDPVRSAPGSSYTSSRGRRWSNGACPWASSPAFAATTATTTPTVIGEAGHSGAVPREYRHDAVLALAELLSVVEARWIRLDADDADLVFTSGIVGTNPEEHSATRIPGDVRFTLDMRSESMETIEAFDQFVRREGERIGQERGVRFDLGPRVITEPAAVDQGWSNRLREKCLELNMPYMDIASGAGHDAAVFSKIGVPAAMIFVRNDHGSHNPDEAMEMDDFMKGVEVLYRALTG